MKSYGRVTVTRCTYCNSDLSSHIHVTGKVIVERDSELCEFCEGAFCSDRCYAIHECEGHKAEIDLCVWCDGDITLGLDPMTTLDGDRYHTRCVQSPEFQATKDDPMCVCGHQLRHHDGAAHCVPNDSCSCQDFWEESDVESIKAALAREGNQPPSPQS